MASVLFSGLVEVLFSEVNVKPGQPIKPLKRSDLVAQAIKRLITEENLKPGDRLPRESELQAQFQVSKGTIREALKSLEVQGLVSISTGPAGGGTIVEVPLDRTLQFMQNYLFFQGVSIQSVYGVRQLLEPELAAGAVPYLTEADFEAMAHSITCCDPKHSHADLLDQRREDVNFHDILAAANPNPFLRFTCELINEMIRHLIVCGNRTAEVEHRRFGAENAAFHRDILAAARARDAQAVRVLMQEHMNSALHNVTSMKGILKGRLILDAESLRSTRAATSNKRAAKSHTAFSSTATAAPERAVRTATGRKKKPAATLQLVPSEPDMTREAVKAPTKASASKRKPSASPALSKSVRATLAVSESAVSPKVLKAQSQLEKTKKK